ncbi:DUF3054 domain-containing protein [uncultured Serinicoccus sp.]|uniref:DUF3054 domain-containing protein n=1 Tax=uncultured Serinicoccus sp. TaxID=735514 RepID=UPI002609EE19|nr:DUF3054 domain-containing protein [uncultured Serinicoccus sp.]
MHRLGDLLLLLVFAVAGRSSHELGLTPLGVLATAWPFAVGTAVGWMLTWRARRWWVEGLAVGGMALAVGMLLRVVTGAGTAPAFVIVAAVVLVGGALGWRAVVQALSVRRRRV